MEKEKFIIEMRKLAEGVNGESIEKWVKWAEECVEAKQYIHFVEKPEKEAVEEWLDELYASFKFVHREFGAETARKVVELSDARLCLYPFEMKEAAKALQSGGGVELIFEMMESGLLETDPEPSAKKDMVHDKPVSHDKKR